MVLALNMEGSMLLSIKFRKVFLNILSVWASCSALGSSPDLIFPASSPTSFQLVPKENFPFPPVPNTCPPPPILKLNPLITRAGLVQSSKVPSLLTSHLTALLKSVISVGPTVKTTLAFNSICPIFRAVAPVKSKALPNFNKDIKAASLNQLPDKLLASCSPNLLNLISEGMDNCLGSEFLPVGTCLLQVIFRAAPNTPSYLTWARNN
ncbi:16304_t:CDS:2 [Racocetra persica]|uniref:16304_t:CDS:1 n=1 Tax=Racocetra persica TaxID=160502 RepID=A0ACA9PCE7_9GLOM|nr:16304_t:CDS:2 [Racocetra persica]